MPLFVMATCGSTVLGSFDPLPAVADICQKHDIWMHTDVGKLSIDAKKLIKRRMITFALIHPVNPHSNSWCQDENVTVKM